MTYDITIREKWTTTGNFTRYNTSYWEWEVRDEECLLIADGRKDHESQARQAAELAADLDYKQKHAEIRTYVYDPKS